MFDSILESLSQLSLGEWLGILGILATVIIGVIFTGKKTIQKTKGKNSPIINAKGDANYHVQEKD
ncbi:hypothetical protein [Aliikangiella sp. IMCC44359]|uniref:hypothetical protein n=1 Tax=Aliikangiella sp. IMCC44359 TaxID=3459125 RepID=UPI00403B1FC6